VPDLGLSAGDPVLAAGFYIPLSGDTPFYYVTVRLPAGATLTDNALRAALVRVDPVILVRDVMPIESVGAEDRAVFAGIGAALMGLGGVALVLSVIGVYAMLSFSVSQRTREIAIRSALGASRAHPAVGGRALECSLDRRRHRRTAPRRGLRGGARHLRVSAARQQWPAGRADHMCRHACRGPDRYLGSCSPRLAPHALRRASKLVETEIG
jgi:hypothetical protein